LKATHESVNLSEIAFEAALKGIDLEKVIGDTFEWIKPVLELADKNERFLLKCIDRRAE